MYTVNLSYLYLNNELDIFQMERIIFCNLASHFAQNAINFNDYYKYNIRIPLKFIINIH
jgi:hypothetical protein